MTRLLKFAAPRRMNRAIPLSVRVRSTSNYGGWGEDLRDFVKVVAIDPDQDMIFGPYLTPAGEWATGDGIRVRLYAIQQNRALDMDRDYVRADNSSGRGTFRGDDGYYPRCLLASVPPITTAADLERAWLAITSAPDYRNCTRSLEETTRLRESTTKRLTARIDALAKRRRRLIQKNTNALLMCCMQSPNP